MSDKTYVLSLSADTFNAFKMDFDSSLQRLLQKIAPPSTARSAWR